MKLNIKNLVSGGKFYIDNVLITFSDPPAIGESFKVSNTSENCMIFRAEWDALLCEESKANITMYIIEATDTEVKHILQSKSVELIPFLVALD